MNNYSGFDKKIVDFVRFLSRRLKVLLPLDIEDIEQEFMIRVVLAFKNFDKNKGNLFSFIRGILLNYSKKMIRDSFRLKRSVHSFCIPYDDSICCEHDFFESLHFITFLKHLPHRYRLIYSLMKSHRVSEIFRIMNLSRSSVNRDIKLLACFVTQFRDSENNLDLDLLIRRSFKMKNLSTIETMNTKELSSLEVFDLADLSDQVAKLLSHAKELKAKLDDALNLRFSETVKENLRLEHKDTGTTKFVENGFQIIAEVPKKVTWDSQKIEEIIKTIPESHRRDYIKTTHSIDERIYSNFSYEYQQLFKPARTVTPGKTKFQIKLPEEV